MAAVAAFVGTAALAIALTRAPVRNDASLAADVSGRVCATSGLEAWLGLGASDADGTGGAGIRPVGGTYYTLEFTNVSRRPCRLYGYPEVSAYRASPVCSEQGHVSLSVQAIQARPGVPGYTMMP